MRYRLRLAFLCHDHRLNGDVERQLDDRDLQRRTVRELVDDSTPAILAKYPWIADSVECIDVLEVRITPV